MRKAKKVLAKIFLIDKNIIKKIIDIIEIKNKIILEVGPGTGSLTSAILKKNPKKFIVVEKDIELISDLKENFGRKIKIINKDILKINENELDNKPMTVFGNLPYNISTEILCKWILNLNDQNIWFDDLFSCFKKRWQIE